MNNIVGKIRVWRNFTQKQLAEKANISVSKLRKIEVNQESCNYVARSALAKALNYPLKNLFWEDIDEH